MDKLSALRSAMALGLLAATGLAVADQAPAGNAPAAEHAKHVRHHRFDPVKHTQHRLDQLEAKLNLNDAQQSAWQAYADAALARAQARSERVQQFHARRGAVKQEIDTASRLDKAAERARARADELQKIAQDTRALQQALSPEQQTIFDLYWKSQRPARMGARHRPV